MKKLTLGLTAFTLLTTACASEVESNLEVTDSTAVETVEIAEPVSIPFQEAGVNMLTGSYSPHYENRAEGYKRFEFRNIEGTCAEQGLPEFAYTFDENLEYFVAESLDGEYRDTMVGMTAVRLTQMDKVPLSGGDATCEVEYQAGNNNAEVTCMAEEVEVCSADVEISAIK